MGSLLRGGWPLTDPIALPQIAPQIAPHVASADPGGVHAMAIGNAARHVPASLGAPADIAIVDGDAAMRERLCTLFNAAGWQSRLFADTEGLVERGIVAAVSCILMDVRVRGRSGLDFQAWLTALGIHTPVIFLTAHGDIPMSVRAMKAGAVDFLTKPARDQDLLDAVRIALVRDQHRRHAQQAMTSLRARAASLTPREAEIWRLVTHGLMNKQIAGTLGLSEVTIKMHRAALMRKMAARNVAELTRMATALDPFSTVVKGAGGQKPAGRPQVMEG